MFRFAEKLKKGICEIKKGESDTEKKGKQSSDIKNDSKILGGASDAEKRDTSGDAERRMGKYIYGIIMRLDPSQTESEEVDSDREIDFGHCGITGNEKVYTVSHKNISAVVSDSEISDYNISLKATVAQYLLGHQRVIERVMENFVVIPMRLGTFAHSEAELRQVLGKIFSSSKDVFDKILDKMEIDVVGTWNDFTAVLKEVGEEKEIKEIKEEFSISQKAMTVDEQIKIGVMVKKALDKKKEECAKKIEKVLRTVSSELKLYDLSDDKMVINTAILIEKVKEEDLYKKVEQLNTKFQEKLNFRCVGPLPPYSFCTFEIKRMDFKEIDQARKRFALEEIATTEEIKKAYKKLSLSLHPDKNHNKTDKKEWEFDEMNKAHKVLVDYCEASEQGGYTGGYFFSENMVKKNAILVKLKD